LERCANLLPEPFPFAVNALGGDVIGKEQCQKLQSLIMSMETAKDFAGLFELTTAR
jgi:hypothetical protein